MFFPEAAEVLKAALQNPSDLAFSGASIDTRILQPGNLFVALPGVKVDGHTFLPTAFEKGASGALISKSFAASLTKIPSDWKNLLVVEDPAAAFLKLAGFYKLKINPKHTIGVVGSVGKTSTKEFLAYLLKFHKPTLATQGNLNNHLGLPLTLFRLTSEHHYSVCELGTNRVGDVRELSEVAKPTAGVLTRIAPEHLEGFGSMENVYRAEWELFESLPQGAVAVMPDDDPVLLEMAKALKCRYVLVGTTLAAQYRVSDIHSEHGKVIFQVNGQTYSFPGVASFLSRNAAMAIAMADQLGFSMEDQPKDWGNLKLPAGRFQERLTAKGVKVIFDGYNASPASFEAALMTFSELACAGKKFLVFSDMLELGAEEKRFHEELGEKIARIRVDGVIAYGPRSKWAVEVIRKKNPDCNIQYEEDVKEASRRVSEQLQQGDLLLLKASRGMKVENVLEEKIDFGVTNA